MTVAENGSQLYSGPFGGTIPVTLSGSGYETVQVTVTDIAGPLCQDSRARFLKLCPVPPLFHVLAVRRRARVATYTG